MWFPKPNTESTSEILYLKLPFAELLDETEEFLDTYLQTPNISVIRIYYLLKLGFFLNLFIIY